jgi:hypothetical protein
MEGDWVPIYSTDKLYQAEIIKQVLADNQIAAFVLNQRDSVYQFGNIEICVKRGDIIRAKHILKSIEF